MKIEIGDALRIKAGLSSCRRRMLVGVGLDLPCRLSTKNVDSGMARVEYRVQMGDGN